MATIGKVFKSSNPIVSYCTKHSSPLHPVQEKLIKATLQQTRAMMLGSQDELQLLQTIAVCMGAKKTLDIGVFTGYSALTIALGLPEDGKVVACDIDEFAKFGKPYWEEAGVGNKIDLRIAPATETLESLIANGEAGTYDFAFIDADKLNYKNYYNMSKKLVRSGGIIAVDNVLWSGKVAEDDDQSESTVALRQLNDLIAKDDDVVVTMLQIGDGTSIVRKK